MAARVAVVTGGTRGIGRAVAVALAGNGYRVAVVGRQVDAVTAAAKALPNAGAGHVGLACDVRDPVAVGKTVEQAATSGTIEVLVNVAGVTLDGLLMRQKAAEIQDVIATNLLGAIYTSQAVSARMLRSKTAGSIVNIGSVVGKQGNTGQVAYAASKAGLSGLTKSLALELASRNIRVNMVSPGFITTDMTSALTDEQRKKVLAQIPLARLGTAEDVAKAVVFLNQATYITGQELVLDGGLMLGL